MLGTDGARTRYRHFVESGLDEETRSFYGKRRLAPVLGGDAFRGEIRRLVEAGSVPEDREVPDARRVSRRQDLAAIARAVCVTFRIDEEARSMLRGRDNE